MITPPANLDDIDHDDDTLVALWWRRSEHCTRSEHDAAKALDWVHSTVHDRMWHDDMQGTVLLVDRLLDSPGAVPEVAADCILDELLTDRGPEVAHMITGFATRYPRWQTALRATDLSPEARHAIPELAPFLPDTR